MASSVSSGIFERLFLTYMGIALVVGGLVIGWLLYSIWRFRERPGDARPRDAPVAGMIPAERGHVLWTYVMAGGIAAIMFGLAFSTISAVHELETPPEGVDAIHMNVTGFQFGWRFNHTGTGGVAFSRVGELTVPAGMPIVMNVTSSDVWHNFAIPDYRIRIDAVPGEVTHIWFQAHEPAETHIACVQLCGSGHAIMRADLHVLAQADYDRWLAEQSASEYARLVGRGAAVNVTYDGAAIEPRNGTTLPPRGPAAFNVTNAGGSPVEALLRESDGSVPARVTVPAGGSAYLYHGATTRAITLVVGGDEETFAPLAGGRPAAPGGAHE